MWGVFLVLGWEAVANAQPMMEGIRPKFHREICSKKHGTNCVGNHTMSSFHEAILIGRIITSGTNIIAKSSKEAMDFGVVEQFTSLVKEDILSGTFRCM